MSGTDNYSLLIDKLDQFIRKYYINQIIRGTLFTVGSVLLLFLAYNLMEHEFYFSKGIRKGLFYSFNLFSAGALAYWVGLPLMHYFKLGQVIGHEQAARIIGDHFADVKDKLLNILQLRSQMQSADQIQLIEASIQQKSAQIHIVPFKNAIDLNKNRKYLRFALPPLLLLLVLLLAAPSVIRDSSRRIIRNNEEFEKAAPFHFKLKNENPSVVQFDNYTLDMEVNGTVLPAEVFIEVDQYPYRMTRVDANHYTYTFNNVQKNTGFAMFSGAIKSKSYELAVLKKPNLSNFTIRMEYPSYIGRKAESLENIGDLLVPEGTRLAWQIDAENTDKVAMAFGSGTAQEISRNGEQYFTHRYRAMQDQPYKIYISNEAVPQPDSILYQLRVVADQYPSIQLEQFVDSMDKRLIYFAGNGSDDYGLSKLNFHYSIIHPDGKQENASPVAIPISNSNKTTYQYEWDSRNINLKPGDQLSYYFELFDNDGIHGSKSVKSNVLSLRMPSEEELENQNSKNNNAIRDELKQALEQSRSLQQQMDQLREKMIQEKKPNWQLKKELEKLLEKQKEIQKKIDEARKKFEENLKNQELFEETSERILEKQEQIEKMFEQLQDPKMQELMEKIQELLQQMEKDQTLPMMEEMNVENQELEKELDRMMELFKTLEVEHQMQQAIDKLREMAKEEEQLSEQTRMKDQEEKQTQNPDNPLKEQQDQQNKQDQQNNKDQQNKEDSQKKSNEDNKSPQEAQDKNQQQNQDQEGAQKDQQESKSQEELQKQQEELNEKMEKLQEEMKELEKKNEDLQRPKEMGEPQEKMEDIKKEMQNSSKQMQQKQNSKASKSQKNAAQKMKEMAQSMENQMQQEEQEQAQEDVKALRQLLENLVTMSFDQEGLIKEVNKTMLNTPRYTELLQQQFKIKEDFSLIEDSLQALSKRVFQLEAFVTEKVNEIKAQMGNALDELEERNKAKAGDHQQRTMKNVNDLALMLSESMENMQAQASGAACANPKKSGKGDGQKPMDKITEGQKGMKEQLEQMKKSMEEGKGQGSKEFAKAAARQAALREALRELQKEKQQRGENTQELQKAIEGMDKTETELVNKKLTNEMMQRQNEILTRLLEAENAERERKQDEKRKSETAQELERKLPPSMQEYLKKREAEIDLYKTVSPDVKPYYRSLIEEYMKSLRTEHGNTINK